MDVYSLVASTLAERPQQRPMGPRDEQLYYAQVGRPWLPSGLAASMATLAGVVLVLLVGGCAM